MLVSFLLLFCWYNLYIVTCRLAASQLAIGLLILPLHAVTTAINNHLLNSLAIYQNHPHFIDIKLDSLQILDHHATGVWVGILVRTQLWSHLRFIARNPIKYGVRRWVVISRATIISLESISLLTSSIFIIPYHKTRYKCSIRMQ